MADTNGNLKTRELRDVEILRTGTFDGVEWTQEIMDHVVQKFNEGVAQIPIKVTEDGTHDGAPVKLPGGPALGWVDSLKRVGDKLLATFKQVPALVADLIASGPMKLKSVEGWKNFRTADGVEHGRVLDGCLFFGQGLPAVHGLSDLALLFQAEPAGEGRFACCADTTQTVPQSGHAPASPIAPTVAAVDAKQNEKANSQKGQRQVDGNKIEFTAEEYKRFLAAEQSVSSLTRQLEEATAKAAKAEADRVEMQKQVEGDRKSLAEYREKDVRVERERIAAQVEEHVKSGRLKPAEREAEIAYMLGVKPEQREERFKLMANLKSLFGETMQANAAGPAKSESQDIHDKSVALQTATGCSYEEASAAVIAQMGGGK
jgi:hypothetical protein